MITKYTVLDERRREAKEGKSQRQNPRSFTRGANIYIYICTAIGYTQPLVFEYIYPIKLL